MDRRKSLRNQKQAATQKNTDDGTSKTSNRGLEIKSQKNQSETIEMADRNLRKRKQAATQKNSDDGTSEMTNRGLETKPQKNQSETIEMADKSLRKRKQAATQKNTDDGTGEMTNRGLETKPQKNQSETSEMADKSLRKRKRAVTQKNADDGSCETTNDDLETESQKNQPGTSEMADDGLETASYYNQPGTSAMKNRGLETKSQKNLSETSEMADKSLRTRKLAATQKNVDDGSCETTNDDLETESQKNQPGTSEMTDDGSETGPNNNQPGTSATTDDSSETKPQKKESEVRKVFYNSLEMQRRAMPKNKMDDRTCLNNHPDIASIAPFCRAQGIRGKTPLIRFGWTQHSQMAMLMSMIGVQPYGLHKHIHMYVIKMRIKKLTGIDVPINQLWSYLGTLYDLKAADELEPVDEFFTEKKDFELPQTDDWRQLIEEQRALIQKRDNENTDAIKQASQAAISKVDLKTFKSVKIMVEKLDSHHSILMNCLKSNK